MIENPLTYSAGNVTIFLMKQKIFYTEFAYIFGLIALAVGTAMTEKADFGMSMVVAPAYLLHLKVSQYLSWFSFGIAEYCVQAVLFLAMCLAVRKFRAGYLFAICTALLYGVLLDGCVFLFGLFEVSHVALRILFYAVGFVIVTMGVSMLFHTYITPSVYETFVKEISTAYHKNINVCKTVYDCTSCLVAIVLSFVFFGFPNFRGIGIGTVVCAFLNGPLIGMFSKLFERIFVFKDGLPLKKYFMPDGA